MKPVLVGWWEDLFQIGCEKLEIERDCIPGNYIFIVKIIAKKKPFKFRKYVIVVLLINNMLINSLLHSCID